MLVMFIMKQETKIYLVKPNLYINNVFHRPKICFIEYLAISKIKFLFSIQFTKQIFSERSFE